MPTISRFFGIAITMYFDDHAPPHFHARHADGQAKIAIEPVEPIDSSLPPRQLRSCWRGPSCIATNSPRRGGGHARVRH